jgi:hypothetical protein
LNAIEINASGLSSGSLFGSTQQMMKRSGRISKAAQKEKRENSISSDEMMVRTCTTRPDHSDALQLHGCSESARVLRWQSGLV